MLTRLSALSNSNKSNFYFILVFFIFILLLSFSACLKDDSCKNCRIETYENGVLVSQDDWVEYCDQALKDVQGQTSTVGNRTTKMVCR